MRALSILAAQSAAKSFLKASNKYLAKHQDWSNLNMPDDHDLNNAAEELAYQTYELRKDGWTSI
jgi:hypothetical protein